MKFTAERYVIVVEYADGKERLDIGSHGVPITFDSHRLACGYCHSMKQLLGKRGKCRVDVAKVTIKTK